VAKQSEWIRNHKRQIKAGLCAHHNCERKHIEGNRCCKEHREFYRQRNAKYARRLKDGLAGKKRRS
jgi:hypothetical protein